MLNMDWATRFSPPAKKKYYPIASMIFTLHLGFPIAIPLRGIARNCAELRENVFELRTNVRNCAQLL